MDTEGQIPEKQKPGLWGNKKSRLLIILLVLGSLIAAIVFFFPRTAAKDTGGERKEPLFHRDEPVKEQILQEDYKEKVHEMLDSGKNIGEVSRETGLRKDVVRKIKKGKE
jgi:hypothetical protein